MISLDFNLMVKMVIFMDFIEIFSLNWLLKIFYALSTHIMGIQKVRQIISFKEILIIWSHDA